MGEAQRREAQRALASRRATGQGGKLVHAAAPAGAHEAGRRREAKTVAVLDRDRGFLVVLAKRLDGIGWKHAIVTARTSAKALERLEADALILDLALLGSRRWSWLERVCQQRRDLAIVVCTGPSTVAERVRALRLGADDWLTKPCHPEELIARVEAITLQRGRAALSPVETLALGEIDVRLDQFQAFVGELSVGLTRREYQLLRLLMSSPGEVIQRELIYKQLWGYEMLRNDRSVDVFVHKLRRKLQRASPGWRYVHTHFRAGYRLSAELVERPATELAPRRQAPPERLAA